jgi:hypothetical protein
MLPGLSSRATFQKRQRQTVAVRFLGAKVRIFSQNQAETAENYYLNYKYATKNIINT